MKPQEKTDLVRLFLRGQGVKDLAIFFACREQTVQRVLREAIAGLSALNTEMGMELRHRRSADVPELPSIQVDTITPVTDAEGVTHPVRTVMPFTPRIT